MNRGLIAVLAALGLVVLAGCVGPATTVAAYNGKSVHAAQAAESEVQTAHLATEQALSGRLQQPYLETMLSDSEKALSSVQDAFDSIQPPDDKVADGLRNDLDPLISDASDAVSQLRIEARREDTAQMAKIASSLSQLAAKLEKFSKEHGG